jgi:hypothetical protein
MLKIFRSLRKRHSGESRNPGSVVVRGPVRHNLYQREGAGMDTGFRRYDGK